MNFELTSYPAIYPATLESPLGRKRSYEASGMNDEDLAFCFQPSKRTRSRPQHGVESKSSRFVLTSVSGGTIFPIASTRRFLQATKPSSQLTPSNDRGQLTGAMGSRRKTTRKVTIQSSAHLTSKPHSKLRPGGSPRMRFHHPPRHPRRRDGQPPRPQRQPP